MLLVDCMSKQEVQSHGKSHAVMLKMHICRKARCVSHHWGRHGFAKPVVDVREVADRSESKFAHVWRQENSAGCDGNRHVRRGDYLASRTVPTVAAIGLRRLHGVCCRQKTVAEACFSSQDLLIHDHARNALLPSLGSTSSRWRRYVLPEL